MLTNLSRTLSIAVGAALVDTVGYRPLLIIVAVVASAAAVPVLARPGKDPVPASPERPPIERIRR